MTPALVAFYADQPCLIWSSEWGRYWRANGQGYTSKAEEAGRYTIADAYAWTKHCDPDKGIMFERATPPERSSEVVVETPRDLLRWIRGILPSPGARTGKWADVRDRIDAALASRQPTPAPAADAEVRQAFERFIDIIDRMGRGSNAIHDAIIEARAFLAAASPKAPAVAKGDSK